MKHLEMMCETLGVTLSQFFAEGEMPMHLTQEEGELVANYRRLPEELRRAVSEIVNTVPALRN